MYEHLIIAKTAGTVLLQLVFSGKHLHSSNKLEFLTVPVRGDIQLLDRGYCTGYWRDFNRSCRGIDCESIPCIVTGPRENIDMQFKIRYVIFLGVSKYVHHKLQQFVLVTIL